MIEAEAKCKTKRKVSHQLHGLEFGACDLLSITCYSSHRRLDKSSSFSAAHRRSRRQDSLLSEPFLTRQQFRIEEEARRQAEKECKQSIARLAPCDLANIFLL